MFPYWVGTFFECYVNKQEDRSRREEGEEEEEEEEETETLATRLTKDKTVHNASDRDANCWIQCLVICCCIVSREFLCK